MRLRIPSLRLFVLSLVLVSSVAAGQAPTAKPSLVTLKMDASLDQVLDELQKQTDIAVDRSKADSSRAVKIDVKDVPYWEAVEKIAKSSDHRIAFGELGRAVHLLGNESMTYKELPVAIDGLFRLSVRQVRSIIDLENDRTVYDVQLSLRWEPKFSSFLVEVPGKGVTAIDNTGKELTVAEGGGRRPVFGGGAPMTIQLTDVPRSARTIKLLEGSFNVIGAAKMLRFTFDDMGAKEQQKAEEGVTVKVRPTFKEGDELWKATVTLEYPQGGPQLQSFETGAWLSENKAYLVSKDNKRRMDVNGGSNYNASDERRAEIEYFWVAPDDTKFGKPSDWKLVVETPSRLVEIPVKFKLENIPLP